MNVLKIVSNEERPDGWRGFVVEPADLYTATIKHIKDLLASGEQAGAHVNNYLNAARDIAAEDWALVEEIAAKDWVAAGEAIDALTSEDRARRANVLELARKWFTAELRAQAKEDKFGLHILRDEVWRL